MLPEEEIALRRALHASLASKNADDEEPKQTKVKQQERDLLKNTDAKVNSWKTKKKSHESGDKGYRKRQKKLLVQIKSKAAKEKARNSHGKEVLEKKVGKFKVGKKKTTMHENDGKVKKRRRKKKVDTMKDDRNFRSSERYNCI